VGVDFGLGLGLGVGEEQAAKSTARMSSGTARVLDRYMIESLS
jgi:hypothetical protein